jgi:predicted ribosomally synthesized peptide with nif11-like leader
MSRTELHRLLDDLRNDPSLLEESRSLLRDSEAALGWTRKKGYDLTAAEIQQLLDSDRELSDDELDEAAGGDAWPPA